MLAGPLEIEPLELGLQRDEERERACRLLELANGGPVVLQLAVERLLEARVHSRLAPSGECSTEIARAHELVGREYGGRLATGCHDLAAMGGLAGLVRLKIGRLRHAGHQLGHLGAEPRGDVLELRVAVLYGVVEKPRRRHLVPVPGVVQQGADGQGMVDVRGPVRGQNLSGVRLARELERIAQQRRASREVGGHPARGYQAPSRGRSEKLASLAFACVDIGSNTTRLLVADADEGRLRELMTQRVYNRLGESLAKGGSIPADRIADVADTVSTQVRHASEYGTDHVDVVATAAVRDAGNAEELTAAIEAEAGLPVRILSGDEEARLSFLGATKALGAPVEGRVAVVDVGGGSTEIAIGTVTGGVEWSETFRLGSGFLTDSYVRSDPPTPSELQSVRHHVNGTFEGLEPPSVERAVAVGGSATSLRRLVGAELAHDALERGIRILCTTPIDDVARRFELDPRRVRLLPAGILVLETVGDCLGHALTIGGGGLREGVIIEMVAAAETA